MSRRTARIRRRQADRRVQVAVERFGGCLPALPTRQERVLRLRAGWGPPPPASRLRVARRLDLSVRQVRRAERRGLRTLRRACGAAPELPAAASAITPGTVAVAKRMLAAGAAGTPAGGASAGGTAASGSSGDGAAQGDPGGGRGGVRGTSATAPFPPPAAGPKGPPVVPIVLIVAYLAAWFAYSRLRERYYG